MNLVKNLIQYVVGIVFLGWILAMGTKLFLTFMPIVSVVLLALVPIYGFLCKKYKINTQKFGVRRLVTGMKSIFKLGKKSWSFYLILGIAVGFVYEDLIWKMVETLAYLLVGVLVFYVLWESTRLVLKKATKIEIGSFKEVMTSAW